MSIISLEFFQRYQAKLDTAIKEYVGSQKDLIDKSVPINRGTPIATGTNLNDLKSAENYYIENDTIAGNIENLPLSICGKLIVVDNGNNGVVQIYMPNHNARLFQRIFWSNAWGEWVEYAKKGTIYQQTLATGSTSVTFTGLPTTGNHTFDIYTSKAGLDYTSITASSGSLTLVYESQSSDITVYLRVGEV